MYYYKVNYPDGNFDLLGREVKILPTSVGYGNYYTFILLGSSKVDKDKCYCSKCYVHHRKDHRVGIKIRSQMEDSLFSPTLLTVEDFPLYLSSLATVTKELKAIIIGVV